MLMSELKEILERYKEQLENTGEGTLNQVPGNVYKVDEFQDKIETQIDIAIGYLEEWLDEIEDEIEFHKESLDA